MIKFFKGTYSQLKTANRLESQDAICFVTDRQVLIMGGKEYGKDSDGLKIDSGFGAAASAVTTQRSVASGTLFYFKGDQSILRYNETSAGAVSWEVVQQPQLSGAQMLSSTSIDENNGTVVFTTSGASDNYQATPNDIKVSINELESKLSAAYKTTATESTKLAPASVTSGTNNVVVSNTNGIVRTQYGLDNGNVTEQILDTSLSASQKSADLDKTLVNARTLASVYENVKSQATTITAASTDDALSADGFITFTSTSGLAGTTWTAAAHILTGATSGSLKVNDGRLENHIAIRKLGSDDTNYNAGYRAQYALFNENGATKVQIGDTINLVKDQFLKSASYVIGTQKEAGVYEYVAGDNAGYYLNGDKTSTKLTDDVPANLNAADRFLKLVFAVSANGQTPGEFPADSDEYTAAETDNIVYINVNELFDSYTAVNGVGIDQTTNTIYGKVDASTEKGISSDAKGVKGVHYGDTAYLTVGGNGTQSLDFAVNGIKKDISASIEDLDNLTGGSAPHATTNMWLTDVGVDNGRLTGAYLSAYTSGINFNGVIGNSTLLTTTGNALSMASGTYVTANDAISALALHIGNLDYFYDGLTQGTTSAATDRAANDNRTYFVYAVKQTDGLIATSAKPLDGSELQATSFTAGRLSAVTTGNAASGKGAIYTISETANAKASIQNALETIVQSTHDVIASMDMDRIGVIAGDANNGGTASKTVPSAVTPGTASQYEPYKIVNTLRQNDGFVTGTDLLLVAQTVGFEPMANALPAGYNDNTSSYTAYVPVSGYTVGAALSSISNYVGSLNFTTDTAGGAPTSASPTSAYTIVNTIKQEKGQITETKIELNASNTHISAINGALPINTTHTVTSGSARVAVIAGDTANDTLAGNGTAGNIQQAIEHISHILADYLSFHNAEGDLWDGVQSNG